MMSKRKNKISVILLTFLILLTVSFSTACGEPKTFTVNFVLTCEVDGRTVKCLYNGKDYIQPVTVAEGQTLGESLVTPVAVNGETRDYSFVGWFYGDTEITSETVFSDEIFDTNAVTLTVKCKLDGIWTKPY